MALAAGRLRDRVTLMRKTRARDADGGFHTGWAPVGNPIPAEVIGINGKEAIIAEALQGISFYQITIRFRPDITDADQLSYEGKTLNIRSATDPKNRREETMILADTGSPQTAS